MTLALSRPADLLSDECRLDREYKSAHWVHHRLLDFEDLHQKELDKAANLAAPGVVGVGRILARLARRARRRSRTPEGSWSPDPRPELAAKLKVLLKTLREVRDADPRWQAALGWADEPVGEPKQVRRRRAKDPRHVKRRKNDTDESFAKRFALLTADETDDHFAEKVAKAKRKTRREAYRAELYARRRIYWGTWNALCKSVDQARKDVLARRKQGMPAEWRRPKFRDPSSLSTDGGGLRVLNREGLWWVLEMRLGVGGAKGHENEPEEWVKIRAKCGNWHEVPDIAQLTTAKLTRRQDGARWAYNLSVTVEGVEKLPPGSPGEGRVSFDWGHREHGHDTAGQGLRAFVWRGDDGSEGEVLIPSECREALDQIDAIKERLDKTFNGRKASQKLREKNRHTYRRKLERSGVRTEEEANWLRWEMRYERRIMRRRERIKNLRRERYIEAIRGLLQHYAVFVFEGERLHDARTPRGKRGQTIRELQTEEQMVRRKRANRDLSARYEFVSLCEQLGAEIITVSARDTTRECPTCGAKGENGPELLTACPKCGTVRDKDRGAAEVILRRAEEALEDHAAE